MRQTLTMAVLLLAGCALRLHSEGPAARLTFEIEPASVGAGDAITTRVRIEDDFGNLVTNGTPAISLRLRPLGEAMNEIALGNDATVTAADGVATFSTLIARAGVGHVLVAVAEDYSPAFSAAFDVAPAAPSQIYLINEPQDGRAGDLAPIRLGLADAFGNAATNSAVLVTASLPADPTLLGGRVGVEASAGIVTFSALRIERAGAGYVLAFSAPNLGTVTSGAFALDAGAATRLVFATEPPNGGALLPLAPAIAVAVADEFGNITGDGEPIVNLSVLDGAAALLGETSVPAAAGLASFDDVAIDRGGLGFSLLAWSDVLLPATSAPFKVLAAPTGVIASTGNDSHVALSWSAVPGASQYRVFRDGVQIDALAATLVDDVMASPPSVPDAPTGFTASDGTDPLVVALAWIAASPGTKGATHAYTIAAVDGMAASPQSTSVSGWRAPAPVQGYEVSTGGAFASVGLVTALNDATAPSGSITPGSISTTRRAFSDRVELAISGSVVTETPVTYAVRAVNVIGAGPPAPTNAGYRRVGAPEYQWNVWRDLNDPLPHAFTGATGPTYADFSAPADGVVRWYGCTVSAESATTAATARDFGARYSTTAVKDELWVTNGTVNAVCPTDDSATVYVGGSFTRVGPLTGSFVSIDASSAAITETWLRVDGAVNAIAPDGQGGSYIGGTFSEVFGVPRARLAHVLANGEVDPAFDPSPDGAVNALVFSQGFLVVGGAFGTIGGTGRGRIAALEPTGAPLASWNPNADGDVNTIAIDGTTTYIGGTFGAVGGTGRSRIAALDASGAVTAWNPNVTGSNVRALVVNGGIVYAGGSFSQLGVQPRNNIGAIDQTSGNATGWNPNSNGVVNALTLSGANLFAGGAFSIIGSAARNRAAALSVGGCVGGPCATTWNPNATGGDVQTIAIDGSTIYLGGSFTTVSTQARSSLAAVDMGGGVFTAWNPGCGAPVHAIAVDNGRVRVGGAFSSCGGVSRASLAAFDTISGAATAWNPNPVGVVRACTIGGGVVYVGGSFTSPRNALAAFSETSGALLAWNPNPNAPVSTLAYDNGRLYVGGDFAFIASIARNYAAAFSGAGAVLGWDPGFNGGGNVSSFAAFGGNIYVGGVFTSPRNRLAGIDGATGSSGAPLAWSPGASAVVNAIVGDGTLIYAGGGFTTIGGGATRSHVAAIDATGIATAWDPNADGDVFALTISPLGSSIFVGGDFLNIGSASRQRLAEINLGNGLATSFNPGCNGAVRALARDGYNKIYVGGSFSSCDATRRQGLAAFEP